MKRLAIIGTKFFSQQVINFAQLTGEFEFVGYFDDLVTPGTIIYGKPVLGSVNESVDLYNTGLFDCIFIGIGYTRFDLREDVYNKIKGKIPLATIISPTAIIDPSSDIGEGVLITMACIIDQNAVIEDNVTINAGAIIGHDNKVCKHSFIAGRVVTSGFVTIGQRCFIGTNSTFVDNISIVDDIKISAGSVVSKNLTEKGHYMSSSIKLYKVD